MLTPNLAIPRVPIPAYSRRLTGKYLTAGIRSTPHATIHILRPPMAAPYFNDPNVAAHASPSAEQKYLRMPKGCMSHCKGRILG